jgi:hypothetical protein
VTAASLLVTGVMDGRVPIVITTAAACTVSTNSAGCPYTANLNSGYSDNQEATPGAAVTYTLPVAAAGKQFCFDNGYNGSVGTTGTLKLPSARVLSIALSFLCASLHCSTPRSSE